MDDVQARHCGKYETRLPPVAIDRLLRTSLSTQVADGLRQAIRSGFYRPGDILPPLGALAGHLDISLRVARDAVSRLVEENLVMSRPRVGCQVLKPRTKCRHGRVLAVASVENMTSYFHAALLLEVGRLITAAGYVFDIVPLFMSRTGRHDLSPLDDKLRGPVDLAMAYHPVPCVSRRLLRLHVPYVAVGSLSGMRCTTYVRHDGVKAMADFVDACLRRGVHRVLVATYGRNQTVADALERVGVEVERISVPVKFGWRAGEQLEQDVTEVFLSRFARTQGRRCMPDLICATDDFVMRGALAALSRLGIRVPDDVSFVGTAIEGAPSSMFRSLACFRYDPFDAAHRVADAVLRHLGGKSAPKEVLCGYDFAEGDTFPAR